MHSVESIVPHARANGLIVKAFSGETLVYDTERDKAHCLNPTAAFVWKHCDGKTTIAKLAQQLQAELQSPVDEKVIWYALAQLDKYHLLQAPVTLPTEFARLSRREFMQQLKVAAAIAIPVIISITAPTSAQAASCLPSGFVCLTSAQCCSGLCNLGTCA